MSQSVPRYLYSAAMYAAAPILTARLLVKSRTDTGYRASLKERFGWIRRPGSSNTRVHFHSVSVGEALAAIPLIESLLAAHPGLAVSVSVTTPTGRARVEQILGNRVDLYYLPFDLPDAMSRFLKRLNPGLVVLMETELWPNLIHQCRVRLIPTLVVNARMSAKSARRYRRVPWLAESMTSEISEVLAQFPADASRFVDLGCSPGRVFVVGSLKFDAALGESTKRAVKALKKEWLLGKRKVWIAASTHDGEELVLLGVHRRLREEFPDLLLVLVPRHPHRCERVAELLLENELSFVHRSAIGQVNDAAVVLVDTLGELSRLYGLADWAFVGGSLVYHGGHNPIEAALWELPILCGPHTYNFAEITNQLAESGALQVVEDADSMTQVARGLLAKPRNAKQFGRASLPVVERNRGSMQRQQQRIEALLGLSD